MNSFHRLQAAAFQAYLLGSPEFARVFEFWSDGKDFSPDDRVRILEIAKAALRVESLKIQEGEVA